MGKTLMWHKGNPFLEAKRKLILPETETKTIKRSLFSQNLLGKKESDSPLSLVLLLSSTCISWE